MHNRRGENRTSADEEGNHGRMGADCDNFVASNHSCSRWLHLAARSLPEVRSTFPRRTLLLNFHRGGHSFRRFPPAILVQLGMACWSDRIRSGGGLRSEGTVCQRRLSKLGQSRNVLFSPRVARLRSLWPRISAFIRKQSCERRR